MFGSRRSVSPGDQRSQCGAREPYTRTTDPAVRFSRPVAVDYLRTTPITESDQGRSRMRQVSVLSVCAALLVAAGGPGGEPPAPACDADDGRSTLPSGFCATGFGVIIRGARYLVVAPN